MDDGARGCGNDLLYTFILNFSSLQDTLKINSLKYCLCPTFNCDLKLGRKLFVRVSKSTGESHNNEY
jgi:hypothetical protein